MLVLSRDRDQSIMIGDNIEVFIVDIRGEKVRLGINAPAHVPVHRKEVYDAIRREKQGKSGDGSPIHVESLANRKKPQPQAPSPPVGLPQRPTFSTGDDEDMAPDPKSSKSAG